MMKELKIPKLIENADLPEEMSQRKFNKMLEDESYEFEPNFSFDVRELVAIGSMDYCSKGNRLYAYICYNNSNIEYYDYAIVKTDDFYFKTYADYRKAVKEMSDQLVERWKAWVDSLYQINE